MDELKEKQQDKHNEEDTHQHQGKYGRLLTRMENSARRHELLVMEIAKLHMEFGSTAVLDMVNLMHRQPCKVVDLLHCSSMDERPMWRKKQAIYSLVWQHECVRERRLIPFDEAGLRYVETHHHDYSSYSQSIDKRQKEGETIDNY